MISADHPRWKQRFQSFQKAYSQLEEAVSKTSYTRLERAGVIQTFEFTWELAWKTLQDYLQLQGLESTGPRDVIKQAFARGLLPDDPAWLEMLEARNFMSHVYDENQSQEIVQVIRSRFNPLLKTFKESLHRLS